MALSRDAIWQAADALDAEGIKPTLSAVRKRIGSGSFTTIQEAMSEWKLRRQQAAIPAVEPAPPELAERTATLAAEVWTLARAAADRTLAGERQQMEADQAELRSQAFEAVELADALTEESDQRKRELAELREVRAAHERTTSELTELKRRTAEEIHRAAEHANQKEREAIEARKGERAAIERAARAEGQAEALKVQLADLTAAIRPTKGGGKQ